MKYYQMITQKLMFLNVYVNTFIHNFCAAMQQLATSHRLMRNLFVRIYHRDKQLAYVEQKVQLYFVYL